MLDTILSEYAFIPVFPLTESSTIPDNPVVPLPAITFARKP